MLEKINENPLDYKGYLEYGKYLENVNLKQAYLTYENALFYCQDKLVKIEIKHKLDEITYRQGKVEPASIVILSYNNRQLTQQCIESIRETTPESAREIVIVDNNSQDDSVEYLRQQDDIVLVENDFNAGFPGGCNIGIKASKKENDIFLLNNDTVLCANSLYTLRMGLYEKDNYGAAGAVTNNCANLQSVFKSDSIDELKEFGLKNNVVNKRNEIKLMLVGFAVLIKRHVLEKVGYLDERFFPGNFEDDDISLRILKENYQNVLIYNSFIIHLGAVSFQKVDYSGILKKNYDKLAGKYNFQEDNGFYCFTHSETNLAFYLNQIKEIKEDNAKILVVKSDLGAAILHAAYLYPQFEFYGLNNTVSCATISTHLEGVHIEHYFDLENNPFKSIKFDFIVLDSTVIQKDEFEKYMTVLKDMMNDDGKMLIRAKNQSFYMNWFPILKGETDSEFNQNVVYCKNVNDMLSKLDLNVKTWIFYYVDLPSEIKEEIEAIQKVVGVQNHITVENVGYIIYN